MSKTKTITDLVAELQEDNNRLQSLDRLFNQACKTEFGHDVRAIHQIIEKCDRYVQHRVNKQGSDS